MPHPPSAIGNLGAHHVVMVNCTGDTFTMSHSGAIATWIYETSRAAERAGEDVHVITRRSTASEPLPWRHVTPLDYPAMYRPKQLRGTLRRVGHGLGYPHERQWTYIRRVWRALDPLEVEWVVFHNDPEMAGLTKRRFPALKVAHVLHSHNPLTDRFRALFAAVDLSLAVSKFSASWADQAFGLPSGSTKHVYAGVDGAVFRTPGTTRHDGIPVINYIGLTNPGKGVDIMMSAAAALAAEGLRFAVQVVGGSIYGSPGSNDPFMTALHSAGAELRSRGIDVRMPGYVGRAEVPALLGRADISVVPSRGEEAFGLVALEAMSSGCAMLASRSGGLPEAIGDGGDLFTNGDVTDCTDKLRRLVADSGYRADRQRAALKRAESFTWDSTWRQLSAELTTASSDAPKRATSSAAHVRDHVR